MKILVGAIVVDMAEVQVVWRLLLSSHESIRAWTRAGAGWNSDERSIPGRDVSVMDGEQVCLLSGELCQSASGVYHNPLAMWRCASIQLPGSTCTSSKEGASCRVAACGREWLRRLPVCLHQISFI